MSELMIEMSVVPTSDPAAPEGMLTLNARHVRAVHLCGCPGNHGVVHLDDGVTFVAIQRESYTALLKAIGGEHDETAGYRNKKKTRGWMTIVDPNPKPGAAVPCQLLERFGQRSGGESVYLALARGKAIEPAQGQPQPTFQTTDAGLTSDE